MTHVSHALWAMDQGMDSSYKNDNSTCKTRGKRSDKYRAKKARHRAKKKLQAHPQFSEFEKWCRDIGYIGDIYSGRTILFSIFLSERNGEPSS